MTATTAATTPVPAAVVMASSVTPAVAAVVTVARTAVIAESKIQFDRRAHIGGIAVAVIWIVARVGRPIDRTSAESGSQEESGRASFQYTCASSSHLSPLTVNLDSV